MSLGDLCPCPQHSGSPPGAPTLPVWLQGLLCGDCPFLVGSENPHLFAPLALGVSSRGDGVNSRSRPLRYQKPKLLPVQRQWEQELQGWGQSASGSLSQDRTPDFRQTRLP